MPRLGSVVRVLVLVLFAFSVGHLVALGCDRHVAPFDPHEKVVQPDLSKIFPAGEQVAASQKPGLPAPAPAPGPAAEPGSDASPVSGTIELAPELAGQVPKGAVLFLIARNGQGGPPVAVERIADPKFPMRFSIGPEDRMIQGIPFAGPLHLIARIDSDGNATTHSPGDLQGMTAQTVQPGDQGVLIEIDQRYQGDNAGAGAPAMGGAPPFAGAAAAGGAAAAAGPPITGTISLAPELAGQVPMGAVLFLIARNGQGGPPVAVERIADPRFPMRFSIGPENRMIQSIPFAGPLHLIARIDADGNAMTHSPGDLQGMTAQAVQPGDQGVAIEIDQHLQADEAGGGAPAMGGAPPFAGAAAAGGAAAAAGPPITGTISLAPELAGKVPKGAVLFLIARNGQGGPPVAVERIADPRFPMRFSIGPENRMIQSIPFAGPLHLIARVDADGNAMTHTPGDLQGSTPRPVEPGAKGVQIVVDQTL